MNYARIWTKKQYLFVLLTFQFISKLYLKNFLILLEQKYQICKFSGDLFYKILINAHEFNIRIQY